MLSSEERQRRRRRRQLAKLKLRRVLLADAVAALEALERSESEMAITRRKPPASECRARTRPNRN